MAIDLFSLVGKISIEYSDAMDSLDKVSDSAGDASEEIKGLSSETKNAKRSKKTFFI